MEVGKKYDSGKDKWHLVPFECLRWIVKVLTYGAKKYSAEGWREVHDKQDRYFSACMRHLTAWKLGEKKDSESGMPHLAHALCCLIFLLEIEKKDHVEKLKQPKELESTESST